MEDGPGILRVFMCFVGGWCLCVTERQGRRERGSERGGEGGGGERELEKKVDIENQDLLGAGVPGYTRMGGSF